MRRLSLPLGSLLLLAACATSRQDPFAVAERALRGDDLAFALKALDAVPVAHARYPEARAAALGVEGSMRRCHELMLQAMLLRAEWRDAEALVALEKAREIWPALPGIDVLIAATSQRLQLLGENESERPAAAALPRVVPVPSAAAPAGEGALPARADVGPAAAAPVVPPVPAPVAPANDPVASLLMAAEEKLARGAWGEAVADLLALARRFPDDTRLRLRLVRVLHQRALLRYGDGELASAIVDCRRVLELDPQHAGARLLLQTCEHESR